MTSEPKDSDKDSKANTEKIRKPTQGKSNEDKKPTQIKVKGLIGPLFVESIMINGKPSFACFNTTTKKVEVHNMIEYDGMIYLPLAKESYGYDPYYFTSDEIQELASTEISKESILDEIKDFVEARLSARDEIKYLVIGDIFLTYCQEWITTTHFIFAVGETGSGKSTLTLHFKYLGYRCLYGTNIPYADIYNFLGKDEEGAGTIAEDEAQDIGFDWRKISLYKNSYMKGSRQPIMDMHEGRNQIFYWIFCFKAFSGEALPRNKGMMERSAVCHMIQGKPQKNIKKPNAEDLELIRKLRNRCMMWKLQNIENGLGIIESSEADRDHELYDDYLKIMSGTKYEEYGKKTVDYFVKQRHERIWDSVEAKIFKVVKRIIKPNNEVVFQDLWIAIAEGIEISVEQDGGSYVDLDTGQKITRNFLASVLEEKFRGKKMVDKDFYDGKDGKKKQKRVTSYVLDEKDLSEMTTKYNVESNSD